MKRSSSPCNYLYCKGFVRSGSILGPNTENLETLLSIDESKYLSGRAGLVVLWRGGATQSQGLVELRVWKVEL
jgi:hypothetical protein